jgi:uncharacterized protein with HEPN domain
MKKDPKIYLEHIQEAIRAILEFTNDVTEEKFYQSDLLQSAVIRKFEIMGKLQKDSPKSCVIRIQIFPGNRWLVFEIF